MTATDGLLILAVTLLVLIIMYYMGLLPIGRPKKLTVHKSVPQYRPKIRHYKYGDLTITGGRSVGGYFLPETLEYGKGNIVPVPLKLWENVIPESPEKLLAGDIDGANFRYFSKDDPISQSIMAHVSSLKNANTEMLFEIAALREVNQQLRSQNDKRVREDVDLYAELKKKLGGPFIPPQMYKRGSSAYAALLQQDQE